ncbi:phytanoyl-CoA dioxygenase domain-containing protein 1 [Pieris rapae]|uniref:phytanoyl-CoA dioxygenase domain-containing protein 1 n=1 Tax=Pieris rapae TaxID=64459 RepID=UPI000B925761|nr:phytanoyl-CoA dioxygenase domain-containing protein 1 [Pieris rapae]
MHETIRNQLERDGFAVLEDFLRPAECDELVAAGIELTKQIQDGAHRTVFSASSFNPASKDKYFLESSDKIRFFFETNALDENGELKVDPSIALNKVGHGLHLLHPIFRCYTYSDRVKAVCRQLGFIEPAVVQSMYIYKNPGIGGEVKPHQDITYLHTDPVAPIGFWIALQDATIQNGCLWISPGSHKSGVHRRMTITEDGTLEYDRPAPIYPQSSFTPVPVSKGTCILLHGNVVHKSAHNSSDKSRHAYTFHIIERKDNNFSQDNWLQEGKEAPFVNIYTTSQIE